MPEHGREQPGFPSTHWSAIRAAGEEDAKSDRPALSELLERYSPAMRAHLKLRRSVPRDQIDDVLQGFVTGKMLETELIARADCARGRFRTLLLTALDRYVVSRIRHERAEKRGGAVVIENLDQERRGQIPGAPVSAGTADTFDAAWARQVMREAIRRTREQCDREGRPDIWGVFESRILLPALFGTEPPDYAQIVERFGYAAPTQMWNAVRTGKAVFARQIRAVIAEYTDTDEQIESELRDLCGICARLPQDDPLAAYPPREGASP